MARPSYGFTTANTPTTPATATLMMREPLGNGQMWLAYWDACENGSGATAMRTGLQRCTGAGTGTIAGGEKLDTRAPAVATYTEFTRSFTADPTFTGNYLVLFYGGLARDLRVRWAPPRPWACPVLVNGEEIAQKGNAQNGNIPNAGWSLGTPGGGPRRLSRRSREPGIWHQGEARGYLIGGATQPRLTMTYVVQRTTHPRGMPRSTVLLFGPTGTNATQTLTAALTTAAAIIKQPIKVLSASLTTAAAIVKLPQHTLSASLTTAAAIIKTPGKVLSAALTTAATVTEVKVKLQTLTASVTTAATIVKQPIKILAAALTTAATILKAPARILSASSTTTAAQTKTPGRVQAVAVTNSASLTKTPGRVLAAASTTTATLAKSVAHALSASVTTTTSIAKNVAKTIAATSLLGAIVTAIQQSSVAHITRMFGSSAHGQTGDSPSLADYGDSPHGQTGSNPDANGFDA